MWNVIIGKCYVKPKNFMSILVWRGEIRHVMTSKEVGALLESNKEPFE